ncbi:MULTISPECIES: DUF262 domain-containing protein [Bizionia]|uniref:DUF262 domain-containing protein n=1 Tax=Bizionia algoritergicola TaxID=291187 RepID=A0A5D0QWQ7_9FLAO|nr:MULTISPECIES: DUF262 domain-containing protein [Bizionia]OBX22203.1 hypothetical protein BAA08_09675 [Bizionia sp. APA-3]TYB73225.1 DUF262 domain-containing protein [Bizionia algoritergicola]
MNKYNFLNLLSETIIIESLAEDKVYAFDGIQIPMIQRDYAHGREGASEIRKRFLNSIFEALDKNKALELDFIYGSIKQLDDKDYFIPLDGQQRLTTLFLLYWYIGNRELDAEQSLELNNKLKNFTYATRATARGFCNKLCEINLSFKQRPSDEIRNSTWYFAIFEKDPTVKSMLVMLDTIHEKYQLSNEALFSNLSNLTFYILPLDGFELSDELYIKMNARGKQLSDYENFKADLINWLKDDKNPDSSKYQEMVHHHKQDMPYYLRFATKLDTDWTNIFWELCVVELDSNEDKNNDEGENNDENKAIVDPYFQRFWNRYLLNAFIVKNKEINTIEKTAFFIKFYGKEGEDASMSYDNFDLHQSIFKQQSVIKESEKVLDALSKNYSNLKDCIYPSWSKEDNWSLFTEVINQRQRILFYGITIYLEKNEFNIDKFKNWMRVVWNIIIDPDIRTIPNMINAMRLVHKLSNGSDNIYQYLIEDEVIDIIDNSTLKSQLLEERLKSQLILSNDKWEQEIIKAESHSMFTGNIGFLINDSITISEFKSKFEIAKTLFNSSGSNNEYYKEHLIMRSVLSQIKKWSTLQGFDFADAHFNWQFLLRKKDWIGEIINSYSTYESTEKLKEYLEELVSLDSSIESWSDEEEAALRAKNAHRSFYYNGKFHTWLQNSKAISSKWWEYHFYVHRPRSHNDWVMIDVKRNDIVSRLIEDYDFETDQDCNGTNYYAGFKIELYKIYEDYTLEVILDSYGDLKIGFSRAKKDFKEEFDIIDEDIENDIFYIKEYDYDDVITDEDVTNFMFTIKDEIFSETNDKSVFYKIKNL